MSISEDQAKRIEAHMQEFMSICGRLDKVAENFRFYQCELDILTAKAQRIEDAIKDILYVKVDSNPQLEVR